MQMRRGFFVLLHERAGGTCAGTFLRGMRIPSFVKGIGREIFFLKTLWVEIRDLQGSGEGVGGRQCILRRSPVLMA
jgi:hypothetical protein